MHGILISSARARGSRRPLGLLVVALILVGAGILPGVYTIVDAGAEVPPLATGEASHATSRGRGVPRTVSSRAIERNAGAPWTPGHGLLAMPGLGLLQRLADRVAGPAGGLS